MMDGNLLLLVIGSIVLLYYNFIGVVFGTNRNHEWKIAFRWEYEMPMEWMFMLW